MMKEYKKGYYLKMLYFDAARALFKDNFLYFSRLIIPYKCKMINDYITKIDTENFTVALNDKAGCAENEIIDSIIDCYINETLFIIEDDEYDISKFCGVFCPFNGLFVFSDRTKTAKDAFSINLCGCYVNQYNRYTCYSADEIMSSAYDFLKISDNII